MNDEKVMAYMKRKGSATVKEIVTALGCTKHTQLSQTFHRLAKRGQIVKGFYHINGERYVKYELPKINTLQWKIPPPPSKSFEEVAIEFYSSKYKLGMITKDSFENRITELGKFSARIGNPYIDHIDKSTWDNVHKMLKKHYRNGNSIRTYLTLFRSVLKYAKVKSSIIKYGTELINGYKNCRNDKKSVKSPTVKSWWKFWG